MSPDTKCTNGDLEHSVALSVIAPCYNEEENIDALVDRTLNVFDSPGVRAELLLVDDGSTDGTWDKILRRCSADARVRGVRHSSNLGMEGAWQTGLSKAAGRLVCLIDSDLQNRPEDIATLHEAYVRGAHDIIQAVRHPSRGLRLCLLVFSRGLNSLLNMAFAMHSRDNKSGFILCRREVLADILRHRYRYTYFQSFLGVSARARGYTIGEVDTVFEPRRRGESFLGRFPVLVSARICWELLKFRVETLLAQPGLSRSRREEWSPPSVLTEAAANKA